MKTPRTWFWRVVWPDGVIDHYTTERLDQLKAAFPSMFARAVSMTRHRLAYQLDHGIKRPISGQ
jgi:hypothetical protein